MLCEQLEARQLLAAEYQSLRNIPDNNILFIEPPKDNGVTRLNVPAEEFWADYVMTVHNVILDRGLADQIDFITAVGQPHSFNQVNDNYQSPSHGLMQLDQYFAGMTVATGRSQSTGIATRSAVGALHHSDAYANVNGSTTGTQHYYVTGLLGVSDQLGNTVDQVITGLQRSVAADGTKPTGTIYFEENDNARSDIREPQWLAVQAELTARGIPFVEESDVSGGTPLNRNDVRGAVVGNAEALVPNGSTYGANGSLIVALSSAPASAVAVDVQP